MCVLVSEQHLFHFCNGHVSGTQCKLSLILKLLTVQSNLDCLYNYQEIVQKLSYLCLFLLDFYRNIANLSYAHQFIKVFSLICIL